MNMVPNVDMMVPNGVSAGGGGGTLTINSTPITGATGAILWDDTGILQEATIGSGLSFSGGTLTATGGAGNPSPPLNSVQYDNAGAFGGAANLSITGGGLPNVPAAMAYLCNNEKAIFVVPNANGDNWFEGGAGNTTMTGYGNFGTGQNALSATTNGFQNCALGNFSLSLLTGGSQNTAFGNGALGSTTTGIGNTAIGQQALYRLTTGQQNFAMGIFALSNITTDNGHVGIGGNAMSLLTGTTSANIAIGSQALNNIVSGTGENVCIGSGAAETLTTGSSNTCIGHFPFAFSLTTGTDNVGIGARAGLGNAGSFNVFIGSTCGQSTGSGSNNVWLGSYPGTGIPSNTFVLSLGSNNLQLDFGITAAGWTFAALNTPGLMTTNASGTVAIANAAPAAAVPASFSATNRIQLNIGGTTYYIPADTVAW